MTLKIETYTDGCGTTIRLTGRLRAEHLPELEKHIRNGGPKITLDLEEMNLVDVEAVRFLGAWEGRGIALRNCSPYISDWIGKERNT